MKKIKNFILSFALLLAIPTLCACGEKKIVIKTLDAPTDVVVSGTTISWQGVEHASFYDVYINGEIYRVEGTELSVDMLLKSGKYEISVVAASNSKLYKKSNQSELYLFDNRQALPAPQNFEFDKDTKTLSWTKVAEAQNYVLTINSTPIILTKDTSRVSGSKVYVDLANFEAYIFDGRVNTFSVCTTETSKYLAGEQSQVLTYVKSTGQLAPQNVKITKSGSNIYLTFDEIDSATAGYTYFIDEQTDGAIISGSGVDISDKFDEFGVYTISIYANEVLEGGECIFEQSEKSSVQFENIPSFVGQDITDIFVSKTTLSFEPFAEANQYDIKIIKNFYENSDVLAEFSISQTDLISQNKQVDISSYMSEIGKYQVKIVASQIGRNDKVYESNVSTNNNYKVAGVLESPTLALKNSGNNLIITIENIKYAKRVLVYLNDESQPLFNLENTNFSESLSETISKNILSLGNNQFFCKAIGDKDLFLDSPFSDYYNYKIAQINIPSNLKISNGTLTFLYSGDYDEFLIYINGNQVAATTDTQYTLDLTNPGKYRISVAARYQDSEGEQSGDITYIITQKLDPPTNLKVANKVLTFDPVPNATSYDVYITNSKYNDYVARKSVAATRIVLTDSDLAAGNNQIKVLANGDGEVYLTSNFSITYTFKVSSSLDQVSNIVAEIENDKYYLNFDGVSRASSYSIDITNPSQQKFTINTDLTSVDIDRYMTEKGEYVFDITAISGSDDYTNSLATETINFDVMFNKSYYQTQSFFYDGHVYSYVFSDEYSLQDFVLYAVLYGINEVQVYIDNSESAFDLENRSLKSYLPCLSNYGIDFSNGNDLATALLPLLLSLDGTKISNALKLIERAHDQLYLYFDVNDGATKQTDASKNANIYTIKLDFEDGFTINPTDNHGKEKVELYDVQERTDFKIDTLTKTAPVETVAQLIMVVQSGRKPMFVDEYSVAAETYRYAKNILSKICNNLMTDAEKAVAIHDWIVKNNAYANDTYEAASGEPFSVDNLNDMSFFASGTILYHYSVCSGYAQTFTLLCSIEGIDAITTFGLCGGGLDYTRINFTSNDAIFATSLYLFQNQDKLANIGAHSWNRVKLDIGNGKQWYIVDATWDDPDNESKPNAVDHTYMFVNDDFVCEGRKEFFPNGDLYHRVDADWMIINYSATDSRNYYDYAGAVVATTAELNELIATLTAKNFVDVSYNQTLSISMLEDAILAAGLNVNDYEIYIYDSTFAYICRK